MTTGDPRGIHSGVGGWGHWGSLAGDIGKPEQVQTALSQEINDGCRVSFSFFFFLLQQG